MTSQNKIGRVLNAHRFKRDTSEGAGALGIGAHRTEQKAPFHEKHHETMDAQGFKFCKSEFIEIKDKWKYK